MTGHGQPEDTGEPFDRGFQWIVDPAGHRWKVVGMTPVVANLEDAEGRELGVGRTVLREGFASGAWREAEFEVVGLPFGVLQAEFPMPEWLWEARMLVLHVWALELNELDPDVRDAVLEVQADMGWPF